jgi:3-oxoacyl-[acyl-carrier-protein] synthase-3
MRGIQIRNIAIYHPEKVVDNQYYIDLYGKQGIDITGLLSVLGRDKRYVIDNPAENTFTMSVEASQRVLDIAELSGSDLDMIIFTSQTPEYLLPSNALKLHQVLKGAKSTACFDINANCAGMLVAVEQASRYMSANPNINRALVVGADYLSVHSPKEPVYYSNFSESAVAVILEKSEDTLGFIDSVYQTNSYVADNSLFPSRGLSKLYDKDIPVHDQQVKFTPFDDSSCVDSAVESILLLLERNRLSINNIGSFLFSQFSLRNLELVTGKLGINPDKAVYIGDTFGYTATTSPFIALHQALEQGKVSRGDYLLFWTVGAGWQNVSLLFQY